MGVGNEMCGGLHIGGDRFLVRHGFLHLLVGLERDTSAQRGEYGNRMQAIDIDSQRSQQFLHKNFGKKNCIQSIPYTS